MPETNGHNGTPAGNGGTGGNGSGGGAPGESKLAAVLAEAKAVQARAVEELTADGEGAGEDRRLEEHPARQAR